MLRPDSAALRSPSSWLTVFAALAIGGLVWLAWPSASRACSCMPPKPPIVAAREADVVFEGRAGRPVPVGNEMRYTFEVSRVFRGRIPMRIEVYTASHSAGCGRRYEPDAQYLIYAKTRKSQDGLRDNMCSRTRLSDSATEDYRVLGVSQPPEGGEPPPKVEMDEGPTSEPPRIEPTPGSTEPGPPTQAPPTAKRGCTAGEMPHGARPWWLGLWTLLAIAKGRRRILR